MRVEKDFEELLRLFNKNKVRYCIIGAFAVGFYARPRYTKDIDILIEADVNNAKRVIKTLNEFGFGSLKLTENDFCREGGIVQLGYEPVRIDLLTSMAGLNFNKVWKNKTAGKYGKEKAFFIGLNELIESKKISRRKQDLADLDILTEVNHGKR